jgi:hypothetical protein
MRHAARLPARGRNAEREAAENPKRRLEFPNREKSVSLRLEWFSPQIFTERRMFAWFFLKKIHLA